MVTNFTTAVRWHAVILVLHAAAFAQSAKTWDQLTVDAVLALKRGEIASATKSCEFALTVAGNFPPDDPRISKTHMLMGEIHRRGQKPDLAEAAFKRAIAVCESAVGPRHRNLVDPLEALANFYYFGGRRADAVPVYRKVLELVEQLPGKTEEELAMRAVNLAEVYRLEGQYSEAAPLYDQALSMTEKVSANDGDRLAGQLLVNATFYCAWGKFDLAEKLARRALDLREGRSDLDGRLAIATCLDALGEIHAGWGRPSDAERFYRRSLSYIEEAFGPGNPDLAPRLAGVAAAVVAQGRHSEGLILYLRAIRVTEDGLGVNAPELVPLLQRYALVLKEAGQAAQAGVQQRRADAIKAGAAHP